MLDRAKPTRTGRRSTPFFPCYLFVQFGLPSDEYVRVRSAPGVVNLVSFDGVPAAVPDDVVQAIRDRLDVESHTRYPNPFRVGQRVVINDGPFRDLEAIFDGRLTGSGRVRVLIDLLGKQWRVQMNVASLSEAGQKPKVLGD